jgi:acetyltransferase-like isoleucine patch superfamily enzyme
MLKKLILRWRWTLELVNFINKKLQQRRIKLKLGKSVFLGFSVVLEGNNLISHNTTITNSYMGFGSYLGIDSKIGRTKIGRYTSIGPRVICIFGNHPTKQFVSTHPSFFSIKEQVGFTYTKKQLFPEFSDPISPGSPYTISIGNDVWIGSDVRILDGVQIGDGAIVAAGSVVTKNIAPYSIVGGVPAKHIKYRFTEPQIIFLKKYKWWEKPQHWIIKNAHLFADIEKFMKYPNASDDH